MVERRPRVVQVGPVLGTMGPCGSVAPLRLARAKALLLCSVVTVSYTLWSVLEGFRAALLAFWVPRTVLYRGVRYEVRQRLVWGTLKMGNCLCLYRPEKNGPPAPHGNMSCGIWKTNAPLILSIW